MSVPVNESAQGAENATVPLSSGSQRPEQARSRVRRIMDLQAAYPVGQVVALIVIFLWGATTVTGYTSSSSLKSMLVLAALLGLAALPQTLVVLVGGIDFSVPGFIAVGGVFATVLSGGDGWPLPATIIFAIAVCALLGGVSGYLCHRFGANPLVVTLGMYAVLQGGILVWTNGDISSVPPASLTNWTSVIGKTFGVGIPPVIVAWAVVAIIVWLGLSRTVVGRRVYATGTNLRAARLALVRTDRIWVGVFALSAALAALAGFLVAGYSSGASPSMGDSYMFQGLAAVIVGGTSLGGARGDYWRTVLGALILTLLSTILVGYGFDSADTQILFGAIILLVVAGYGRSERIKDRV